MNGSRHANMKELRISAADGEWRTGCIEFLNHLRAQEHPARVGMPLKESFGYLPFAWIGSAVQVQEQIRRKKALAAFMELLTPDLARIRREVGPALGDGEKSIGRNSRPILARERFLQ
jgi:hypothetical protein